MLHVNISSPFNPTTVLKSNILLFLFVILCSLYALYEGTRIPAIKQTVLYSKKIQKPLTIAVLSDIHIHRALSPKKLKGIIKKTNEQQPDIIALPGDIIDDYSETIRALTPLLSELKAPLGTYVTDGNHEFYIGLEQTQKEFKDNSLIYLNNEFRQLRPDVYIAGIPDIQSMRFNRPINLRKALPDTKAYTVLLSHAPKTFDMTENTADLQLSGHTHGGQIFPFHILTWLSNKYLAGLYQKENRSLYVSRGAGQWGPQMRLFAPSEISIIKIYPIESNDH